MKHENIIHKRKLKQVKGSDKFIIFYYTIKYLLVLTILSWLLEN